MADDTLPAALRNVGLVQCVELAVSDLPASAEFWRFLLGELGWESEPGGDGAARFTKGATSIVLRAAGAGAGGTAGLGAAAQGHDAAPPGRGLHRLSFHARDRSHVDAITEMLHGRMEPILYEDSHPFARGPERYAVYVADPDGLEIEIVAPQGYVPPETKPGALPLV